MHKKISYIVWFIIIVLGIIAVYFVTIKKSEVVNIPVNPVATTTVEYKNTDYGFTFTLPDSWSGFSIVTTAWQGSSLDAQGQNYSSDTGPLISIRHPAWTTAVPRQDIPIMVFTLQQWNDLQADKFHIGAAPIGPSELGRNATYVFAIPARYNFAFPVGFEEVDQLIQGNNFQAF